MTGTQVRLNPQETPMPRLEPIPRSQAFDWRPLAEDGRQASPAPILSVFMAQYAYVRACAHAGSDLDNEVGGWLVGKWRADPHTGEQFVVIESTLPAVHTRQGSAYLTFTQDSQVAMHALFEERYPDSELVGWYHTHPRMGVFLSEYDTWLHANFFPEIWQVALVIEPHAVTGGFFIRGVNGFLDPRRYFGFYELNHGDDRSVVHWNNMQRRTAALPAKEADEL
ncbi:MAG: Mov34/MPN/PAD-1 family protein [Anaerolineae bacterium]|nr:Mov34/MPN/PAD-1 family protein [Anaerolineae bacterium]